MAREHSELFTALTQKIGEEFRLKPHDLVAKLKETNYEALSDLLREVNDAQFGIVSTVDPKTHTWLRDATQAKPLEQRMRHDAPVIEANNALLRCLSRLRPIDYAIDKKMGAKGQELRDDINTRFGLLCQEILTIAQGAAHDEDKQKRISQKEDEFNTFLVEQLHKANLTKGCESREDAEKLLFHYRNLSSVLSPARPMVTLTYDKTERILQRETQYPVTRKTETQKQALHQLVTVTAYPFKDEKNAHTAQNLAIQEADSLFAGLMARDDTALPAQARKTHLVGAKNAFIVKNELIEIKEASELQPPKIDRLQAEDEEDVLWLARMGSPVFIGKGEESEAVQIHTRENLEQVRVAAAEKMDKNPDLLNLHVTTLNTYSFLEKQATIINHVAKATKERDDKNDQMSYAATNPDGTFRALDIAQGLDFGKEQAPHGIAPLQKAERLKSVCKVILAACKAINTLSVIHCASGQDRTGTAVEKATQEWMKKRYKSKHKNISNIESVRAQGGNAAEITSHHVPGSSGMKSDSIANDVFGSTTTFSPQAQDEFYLKSAETNKKNHVGDVAFLKTPSKAAIEEYEDYLSQFAANLEQAQDALLIEKGRKIIEQVKAIAGNTPENLDSRALNDLSQVLFSANNSLIDIDDPQKTQANSKRLAALANHVSGNTSPGWHALGTALLTFACASLVIVGVLAAIPSGGSSLLLSAIGAAGLGASLGVGVGIGVAGVAGAGMFYHGREKGLAKSVSQFRQTLFDIKKESQPEDENPDDNQENSNHPQ